MFKVLDKSCVPFRSTKYSAYVDLFSREDVMIGAGETKIVPLGIKLDLDKLSKTLFEVSYSYILRSHNKVLQKEFDMFLKSHYLEITIQDSLALRGLIISNGIGTIDLDYPDEIELIVHNPIGLVDYNVHTNVIMEYGVRNSDGYPKAVKINKGDKVAQCTLKEHKGNLMGYESDTTRDGGFGSTDKGIYNDK